MRAMLLLLLASHAWARGVNIDPSELGDARGPLAESVEQARKLAPELFAAVGSLDPVAIANQSRSRRPEVIGVVLRRLGSEARWALLDLAAFHAPPRLEPRYQNALAVALLDSLSLAAEPKLAPLFRAVWAHEGEMAQQIVAAIGLGKLGELEPLLAHVGPSDRRRFAAFQGLAASHSVRGTKTLAQLLDGANDSKTVIALADAIGEVASSWSWATGKLGNAATANEVRLIATGALERARGRVGGSPSNHVAQALRRVQFGGQ